MSNTTLFAPPKRSRSSPSKLGERTAIIKLAVSPPEYALFQQLAKERGQTIARTVREIVLGETLGDRALCRRCLSEAKRRVRETEKR